MTEKRVTMAEVCEYDRVRVTGKTQDFREPFPPVTSNVEDMSDETLRGMRALIRVENLVGVVGSAYFEKGKEREIKVWPDEDQPYNESGKIWFFESETESIFLLERDE